jgi:voltage-gated potassium channel
MIDNKTAFNKPLEWFLISLVLVNVLAITLSTVKSLQSSYGQIFSWFEFFCVFVFVIEYIARVIKANKIDEYAGKNGRIKYVFSTYALIDLFAIMPYLVAFLFGFDSNSAFIRIIKILTIFRLAKLLRYHQALGLIGRVLKSKIHELTVCGVLIFIFVFLSAAVLYMLEGDVQPSVFSSIPASIWWAVISVTTIGYGDIVPVTTAGKVVSGLLAFVGVALIAIPTSIIAGGFIEATASKKQNGDE